MSEKSSGNPESQGSVVTSVALEMKRAIVALGRSPDGTDNRESMIATAARRAKITFRQARSLFYGETVDPRYSVVERVRMAAAADQKAQEEAAHEYRSLLARIERLETALCVSDEEFHRPHLDALGGVAGDAHRALD